MKITTAQRKRAKIRLSIQGPSGSGKTFSSLLIAKGLVGTWENICVIDTENHSADLYSHLGPYNVLSLGKPFTPEAYIQAIELCEKSGIKAMTGYEFFDSIPQSIKPDMAKVFLLATEAFSSPMNNKDLPAGVMDAHLS